MIRESRSLLDSLEYVIAILILGASWIHMGAPTWTQPSDSMTAGVHPAVNTCEGQATGPPRFYLIGSASPARLGIVTAGGRNVDESCRNLAGLGSSSTGERSQRCVGLPRGGALRAARLSEDGERSGWDRAHRGCATKQSTGGER
jgi:hypothetical protein